jgi:CubicO group peptidase (beta-lactamase class C family)
MTIKPELSGIIILCVLISLIPACSGAGIAHGTYGSAGEFSEFFSDTYYTKVTPLQGDNTSLQEAYRLQKSIKRFDAYVQDLFSQGVVPGMAVAVIYKDKVVYQKCMGVKKEGAPDQVDSDTVFQIGSSSKPFTAATIATMVDDDMLSWDDRIIRDYPEFRMFDPWVTEHLTYRDALVHRSGLPSHATGELMIPFSYNSSEILYRVRFLEPTSDFRTKYEYQNVMFHLAGEAAARAAGKEWPDLVKERIFSPLGMNSTSARYDDYIASSNRVWNHREKNGTFSVVDALNYDPISPAGGVSSSINDMAKWVILQVNDGTYDGKQIISPVSMAETHRMQIVDDAADEYISGYGLGWFILYSDQGMTIYHGGSTTSSTSYVVILPRENVGVVALCNKGPSPSLAQAICFTFKDIYRKGEPAIDYLQYLKKYQDPWFEGEPAAQLPPVPVNATPALPPETYAGQYASDYYGLISIEPMGSGYRVYTGKNPVPFNISHWSGDTFMDDSGVPVIFTVEGNVSSRVFLQALDFNGRNGTFIRVRGG